jgi:hypothetical protein
MDKFFLPFNCPIGRMMIIFDIIRTLPRKNDVRDPQAKQMCLRLNAEITSNYP